MMTIRALTFAGFWTVAAVSAQQSPDTQSQAYAFRAMAPSASPRIARLRSDIQLRGPGAVEQFWNDMRRDGAPIIETVPGDDRHSRVTFVWRGSTAATNVVITDGVAPGVGGVDPVNSEMTHIGGTDVWYRTYDVRNDARFTYALSENDPLTLFTDPNRTSNSKPDPMNPRRFLTGQTYVELRDAPAQPWISPAPADRSGKLELLPFTSAALGSERNVWVYTPRGFSPSERYPLLVALGGAAYTNFIPVPVILDNLIAQQRIPPVVAVIVGFSSAEAMCSPAFAGFLAKELVPWMQTTFRATNDPSRAVIAGSSLGALASTFAAFTHSDVFGNVLSQSGSYWWKPDGDATGEWMTRRVSTTPTRPVRFFMEVGLMEVSDAQVNTNRRMRDALIAKGYTVEYQEFNGNHNYINWRGSFAEGLQMLLR